MGIEQVVYEAVNAGKSYTISDQIFICQNIDNMSIEELASKFKRDSKAILRLIARLKSEQINGKSKFEYFRKPQQPSYESMEQHIVLLLPKKKRTAYTTQELSYICKNYKKGNVEALAKELDRTVKGLSSVVYSLKHDNSIGTENAFTFYKNL